MAHAQVIVCGHLSIHEWSGQTAEPPVVSVRGMMAACAHACNGETMRNLHSPGRRVLAHRAKRRGPRTTVGTGVQNCPPVTFSTGWAARGAFEDVSFDLSPDEIVGMAGLVGAGRSDVVLAIYGAVPAESGQLEFCGTAIETADIAGAIRSGMALVAENRREHGLVLGCSILENMSLPYLRRFQGALGLNLKRERREVDAACRQKAV